MEHIHKRITRTLLTYTVIALFLLIGCMASYAEKAEGPKAKAVFYVA